MLLALCYRISTLLPTQSSFAKKINGTSSNDLIVGKKNQADKLRGLSGNDRLDGRSGNDHLSGGNGGDNLFGGKGKDKLFGGNGNDNLVGYSGNDRLQGEAGNDGLVGSTGDDLLYGGMGDDRLVGGKGKDKLYGGLGKDSIWVTNLSDRVGDYVDAGHGNDSIKSADGYEDKIVCGDGTDKVIADQFDDIDKDCEKVTRIDKSEYVAFNDKALKYSAHLTKACDIPTRYYKSALR